MTGNSRRWLPTVIVVLAVAAMGVAARRDSGLDAGTADGLWKGVRPAAAILTAPRRTRAPGSGSAGPAPRPAAP